MEFRKLRADEIECRIGTVKKGIGFSLLLYKDARCDMALLDEKVGTFDWQRDHKELKGVIYCGVGINRNYMYPEKPAEFVWKWDAGTESKTEKEKGESSDSFKRACFNWGIGRELYTAPFIWLKGEPDPSVRYVVNRIDYDEDGHINGLEIVEQKSGEVAYTYRNGRSTSAPPKIVSGKSASTKKKSASTVKKSESMEDVTKDFTEAVSNDQVSTNTSLPARRRIILFCNEHQLDAGAVAEQYGIERDMSEEVYAAKLRMLMEDYGQERL